MLRLLPIADCGTLTLPLGLQDRREPGGEHLRVKAYRRRAAQGQAAQGQSGTPEE